MNFVLSLIWSFISERKYLFIGIAVLSIIIAFGGIYFLYSETKADLLKAEKEIVLLKNDISKLEDANAECVETIKQKNIDIESLQTQIKENNKIFDKYQSETARTIEQLKKVKIVEKKDIKSGVIDDETSRELINDLNRIFTDISK